MTTCNFVVKNGLDICGPTTATGNVTICTGSYLIGDGSYLTNVLGTDQFARDKANSGFDIGTLGYAKSNSAFDIGTLGYAKANSGYDIAVLAFDTANNAGGADQYARDTANSAFDIGTLGYAKANAAYDVAALAYDAANTGGGGGGAVSVVADFNIVDCITSRTLSATQNNLILGNGVGNCLQGGCRNVLLGSSTASALTCSNNNIIIGCGSASTATYQLCDNIAIGTYTSRNLLPTSFNNIQIGQGAGSRCTSFPSIQKNNISIGKYSGFRWISSAYTTCGGIFIGCGAYAFASGACVTESPIAIGSNTITGERSIVIGATAGFKACTGGCVSENVIIGNFAGYSTRTCANTQKVCRTVFIGADAGKSICCSCQICGAIAIGRQAGAYTYVGNYSVTIGEYTRCTGAFAVGIGYASKANGCKTVSIGNRAGQNNSYGQYQVLIGNCAGCAGGGCGSVAMGSFALECAGSSKCGVVAIGNQAGRYGINNFGIAIGHMASFRSSGCGSGPNIVIGMCAGMCLCGQCNIVIGSHTGSYNAPGSAGYGNANIIIGSGTACCVNGCYNTVMGYCVGRYYVCGSFNTILGANPFKCCCTSYTNCIGLSNTLVLGGFCTTRLMIPSLGLDTNCATSGQVLSWNGTGFCWGSGGGAGTYLGCLLDVCIDSGSLTANDTLCWTGTYWTNSSNAGGGGGGGGALFAYEIACFSGTNYCENTIPTIWACVDALGGSYYTCCYGIMAIFSQTCLGNWGQYCSPTSIGDYNSATRIYDNNGTYYLNRRNYNGTYGFYTSTVNTWPGSYSGALVGHNCTTNCLSCIPASNYWGSYMGPSVRMSCWSSPPYTDYTFHIFTVPVDFMAVGTPWPLRTLGSGIGNTPKIEKQWYGGGCICSTCPVYGVLSLAFNWTVAGFGTPSNYFDPRVCILGCNVSVQGYYNDTKLLYCISGSDGNTMTTESGGAYIAIWNSSCSYPSGACWRTWGLAVN